MSFDEQPTQDGFFPGLFIGLVFAIVVSAITIALSWPEPSGLVELPRSCQEYARRVYYEDGTSDITYRCEVPEER